jgi:hypothetical protein
MQTFHLELTITHTNGRIEHDFVVAKAESREQAVTTERGCLDVRLSRKHLQPFAQYRTWQSYTLR